MERPTCVEEGCDKPCDSKGYNKNGDRKWKTRCSVCHKKKYQPLQYSAGVNWKYAKFKKDSCESCGFIPEHRCQLDVDHIDGNRSNNAENNLQTLCANCHRLKTYLNKDWL